MRPLAERVTLVGARATAREQTVWRAEAALLRKAAVILRDWDMSPMYPEQLEEVAAELEDRAK